MTPALRRRLAEAGDTAMEGAIRLCGWSAIAFVSAIFLFVFREAAPVLFGVLDLKELFTSADWRPDSSIRPAFGILALLAGTASVTILAMALAVPLGLG